jgi:hypothetical protein
MKHETQSKKRRELACSKRLECVCEESTYKCNRKRSEDRNLKLNVNVTVKSGICSPVGG